MEDLVTIVEEAEARPEAVEAAAEVGTEAAIERTSTTLIQSLVR